MEKIEINGNVWTKFKGDEGQDVYVAQFQLNEENILGRLVDDKSYDILIENDCDFYLPARNLSNLDELAEENVAFKFRKNVFTVEEQKGAYEGLYGAAVVSDNRGYAAGIKGKEEGGTRDYVSPYEEEVMEYFADGQPQALDGSDQLEAIKKKHETNLSTSRHMTWIGFKVERDWGYEGRNHSKSRMNYEGFFEEKLIPKLLRMPVSDATDYIKKFKKEYTSVTAYATPIWSGIAGYFGRYPRIPYGRAVAYTEKNKDTFEKSYPFARRLESEFKRLMPRRWGVQKGYADKLDKRFLVGEDTTFSTITVNTTQADRNARMACHRDAGSLNEGFSNLTVVTKEGKNWKGGYLVCPEVRTAINIRPGDLLLIDNMRVIHGNTPIEAPDSGEDDFLRMSLVYYMRENMTELGSWEYEQLRRKYVDSRRLNPQHPLQREFWNGISPGMWSEKEWYDWLEVNGGEDMVRQYHPSAYDTVATLEGFF